uniref:PNPLA domain-containing protein n=1 Tax=viral metagenome TaxID=1070528 RepID=A0A6C0HCF7_9ZZZZ
MIKDYVKKLVENIPITETKETMQTFDIILDGGVFNGSYQIGSLYFLKELENQNIVKIERISCCSVGAFCALLYYTDNLDLSLDFYSIFSNYFIKNKNIAFLHNYIDSKLFPLLPRNLYKKLSNKFYISYYDLKNQKKVIRKSYKSNSDLLKCIKRTTFLPYFIDGSPIYEKRYIDGLTPYIFKFKSNKKILYIDLFGLDKINYVFSIRNEKINIHRILAGILDIHLFFIKQTNTQMCSCVNKWSLLLWTKNHIIKYAIEKIIVYTLLFYIWILQFIPIQFKDSLIGKIANRIFGVVYESLIEHYCI